MLPSFGPYVDARKAPAFPIRSPVSIPASAQIFGITPDEGERNMMIMPHMTTVEMKCGRYVDTWKNFLNLRAYIWLHINASRIGSGKVTAMV